MQIAAAPVDQAANIARIAQNARHFSGIDFIHRMAGLAPLPPGFLQLAHRAFIGGRADPANIRRIALDPVLLDQIKDQRPAPGGAFAHAMPKRAVFGLQNVWIILQAGIDLAAIAARGAPARGLCLQHDDPVTLFGKVQRGREASEARADHHSLGLCRAGQRRPFGRGIGRCRPEAGRERRALVWDAGYLIHAAALVSTGLAK